MTISFEAAIPSNLARSSRRAWLLAVILSLATALMIISPFTWKGNASGHDFSFHAASWMDAAAQWHEGILLPRWTAGANYGFGEPRFVFYPPLSWMFGAALGLMVPWVYVPAVFIVLTQVMAGLSAFALGRRLFPERGAQLCAVVYAANPYALLIIYMRSDFAEQLALAFFPLLFLAALEVLGAPETGGRKNDSPLAFLAITFAAVWLTNAPAGVVASYSLAALFVFTAVSSKSCRPLLIGAAALALGFGLAGFYLVPAIYEQRWVNISQALASGLRPSQNFLYTIIADTEHNDFNRIASNTAVVMMGLTALFAVAAFPRGGKLSKYSVTKPVWTVLLVLSVLAAFLMLRFSNVFWILLPKLRFVQFPWRWMSILAIPFACLAPGALLQRRKSRLWVAFKAAALIAVLAGLATWMVRRTWWDSEDIPVLMEAIQNDEGFEGVDEYDPANDDHSSLPQKSSRVTLLADTGESAALSGARIHVERWSAEKKELRITVREPVLLGLRLLNYPAWRIQVNGTKVEPQLPSGETSQMVVPLAAGQSQVVIRFTRTPDRTIGGILTALSVSIIVLLFFAGRARN